MSEVFVHIASANFLLLAATGVKAPAEYYPGADANAKDPVHELYARHEALEKLLTAKEPVAKMLQASLDAVRDRFSALTEADLERPVNFFGEAGPGPKRNRAK